MSLGVNIATLISTYRNSKMELAEKIVGQNNVTIPNFNSKAARTTHAKRIGIPECTIY